MISPTANAPQDRLMRRALRLAGRGRGRVEPNPMVGAVLARGGRIIGEGFHQRFGGPHAEVAAIDDCRRRGLDPAGADLYVSLEPCSHHGKTPPCADAIIAARIARVFAAMIDPFPQVAGRGVQRLRDAGVVVEVGLLEDLAHRLNGPFIKRVATGLPWVIAKWAQTLDGRIAAADGRSKWISGERSRRFVHQLRGRVDAVVVGVGTVLADDPLLTARHARPRRIARRVIVDPTLRTPPDAAMLADHGPPVTIAVGRDVLNSRPPRLAELESRGVEFVALDPTGQAPASLEPLLRHLAQTHQATNVLAEGGARLLGSLLAQRLIDQYLVFIAPRIMGDPAAVPAFAGPPCPGIDQAVPLRIQSVRRLGDDLMLDYRPV